MTGGYVGPAKGDGNIVWELDRDAASMSDSPVRLVHGWAMGRRIVDVMDLEDEPGPDDLKAPGR